MSDSGMSRRNSSTASLLLYVIVQVTVLVAGTQGAPRHQCPHGGSMYDGRCYWVSERRGTWTDANILCHRLYGDNVTLATIKDEETNRFISKLRNSTVWIGLHETHGENKWRWVDNTLTDRYSNWAESAPSDLETKNCATMLKKGDEWQDVACRNLHKFVCNQLPSAHACSKGGIFFRDRCYWPVEEAMPFSNANGYCQEHFGNDTRIAVAKDHRTNLFLSRLIYPRIWLGLHDKKEEGTWKWVDNSPLHYSNWRQGEPNNVDDEDCATLNYEDAKWNDVACGRYGEDEGHFHPDVLTLSSYDASELLHLQPIRNMDRFVCAVPSCYDTADDVAEVDNEPEPVGSGSPPDADIVRTSTVCLREECSVTCVDGSICGDTGECMCTKEFPEMVCDENEFNIEITPTVVRATLGGKFTLKCQINLPPRHLFIDTLAWAPIVENRTTITHFMHRGYSLLEVTDVQPTDNATEYTCSAILMSADISSLFRRSTAVVRFGEPGPTTDVTHGTTKAMSTSATAAATRRSTHPSLATAGTKNDFTVPSIDESDGKGKGPPNNSQTFVSKQDGGSTVAIILLSIFVTILAVAVIALMLKIRKMEQNESGMGRLMELHESN